MASIKYGYGPAFITRERNSSVMYVRINLRGQRSRIGCARSSEEKINRQVKIPEGYKLIWAGQYEFLQDANQRLMIIVPVTIAFNLSDFVSCFRLP